MPFPSSYLLSPIAGGLLPLLALLVVCPALLRRRDSTSLPPLAASSKENHRVFPVPSEVDSITGPEIDRALQDPFADAYHVREVACRQSVDGRRNLRSGAGIKIGEPGRIWRPPPPIEILKNSNGGHASWQHKRY